MLEYQEQVVSKKCIFEYMNTDEYLPKNTVTHEIQGQESFLLSKKIGN